MSVQEYLDKYMLSRKIEDAVNAAVRAKTSDPVLFISNHMRKAVSSVITKIKAKACFGLLFLAEKSPECTKYDLDYKCKKKSKQNFMSGEDMIELYRELCAESPIVSIEDPFDKEDWEHVKDLSSLGLCQVVGDDLLTSNPKRIERAMHESACHAFLLKGQ